MSTANQSFQVDADAISAVPLSNADTLAAIDEGENISHDPNVKGYHDISVLIEALNARSMK